MSMQDRLIKRCEISIYDHKTNTNRKDVVNEKDDITMEYKNDDGDIERIYGMVAKIGIEKEKIYLVVLLYDYFDSNPCRQIFLDKITKVIKVSGSNEKRSFSPIYTVDEAPLLFRQNADGSLAYSSNGKDFHKIGGVGGTESIPADVDPISQAIINQAVFEEAVERGYKGTQEEYLNALAAITDNSNEIIIRKEQSVEEFMKANS